MLKPNLIKSSELALSLSKEEMIMAVQVEKERRAHKGFSFNCLIVSAVDKYKVKGKPSNYSELVTQLHNLKKGAAIGIIKANTRVQLLVNHGAHWTAVDIELNTEKGTSIFILDAAGDDRYLDTLSAVTKIFSNTNNGKSMIYVATHGIQWDMTHCAVFSLHHVFKASKIADLHEDLAQRRTFFPENKHTYYQLNMTQLPPMLVTTTQKSSNIGRYLTKNWMLNNYPVTKRGKTTKEIIWENTQQEGKYITNKYIFRVKEKVKKIVKNFIERSAENELAALFAHHQAFTMHYIRNNQQPPYHVHRVSGLLSEGLMVPYLAVPSSLSSTTDLVSLTGLFAKKEVIISQLEQDETPLVADEFAAPKKESLDVISSNTL